MSEELNNLCVSVYDGKYTVIQNASGAVRALRYGEEWRDCCGDGLILALAQEVEELREKLAAPQPEQAKPDGDAAHKALAKIMQGVVGSDMSRNPGELRMVLLSEGAIRQAFAALAGQ